MDFIPFSNASSQRNKTSSPHKFKNSSQKSSPSSVPFGSPALGMPAFGSPAVGFGAPAVHNSSFNSLKGTPSPRHYNQQFSPRSQCPNNSPRAFHHQSPRGRAPQFSPYANRDPFRQPNDNYRQDNSGFKTPHQYSPNRGRGNGRKSIGRHFGQTSRLDCNAGGSLNIEDYYHPSMVDDPWRNLSPVFIKT